jgi:uncharacterized membrane protein (GlpM family)
VDEIITFIVKLLLAVAAFVLVGWLGARDKRIGGVLLTFPLLNGIAMLTGADPPGIARTIYLVVMWNCGLFLALMHRFEVLPPLPAGLDREVTINTRAFTWVALWMTGAVLLAVLRDDLPSAWWLFAIQLVLVAGYVARRWRRAAAPSRIGFKEMWINRRGGVRILCFVAVFLVLSSVAYFWHSARWVGWASALPLPGIFALATLSVTQTKEDMRALGDTVLLGPLLVIPFNALLAHAMLRLRAVNAGTLAEIATVVAFWAVAAAIVFVALPPLARWRDRR